MKFRGQEVRSDGRLLVSRVGMLYCATANETSLNKNRNSDIPSRPCHGGEGSDNDVASGLVKASRHGLRKDLRSVM
jgi:hypothetical protein